MLNSLLVGSIIPLCSTYMIILNVYNGDILGIDNNLEYLLWYILPVVWCSGQYLGEGTGGTQISPICWGLVYLAWVLGIVSNLYWYYQTPFRESRSLRHRTEYYDTQVFLSHLLYLNSVVVMLFKFEYLQYPPRLATPPALEETVVQT